MARCLATAPARPFCSGLPSPFLLGLDSCMTFYRVKAPPIHLARLFSYCHVDLSLEKVPEV